MDFFSSHLIWYHGFKCIIHAMSYYGWQSARLRGRQQYELAQKQTSLLWPKADLMVQVDRYEGSFYGCRWHVNAMCTDVLGNK